MFALNLSPEGGLARGKRGREKSSDEADLVRIGDDGEFWVCVTSRFEWLKPNSERSSVSRDVASHRI
jgi:hypothetical protein